MKKFRRFAALLSALGLAVSGGAAPIITGGTSSPISITTNKDTPAMPERARKSHRDLAQLILGGATHSFAGAATGRGWLIRRTNNFRRRGVGSRWQSTMRSGRATR